MAIRTAAACAKPVVAHADLARGEVNQFVERAGNHDVEIEAENRAGGIDQAWFEQTDLPEGAFALAFGQRGGDLSFKWFFGQGDALHFRANARCIIGDTKESEWPAQVALNACEEENDVVGGILGAPLDADDIGGSHYLSGVQIAMW